MEIGLGVLEYENASGPLFWAPGEKPSEQLPIYAKEAPPDGELGVSQGDGRTEDRCVSFPRRGPELARVEVQRHGDGQRRVVQPSRILRTAGPVEARFKTLVASIVALLVGFGVSVSAVIVHTEPIYSISSDWRYFARLLMINSIIAGGDDDYR